MTTTEIAADTSAGANRTGVYLAVLQLVFTLGWTTYVIYLPKLAAQVGIAPTRGDSDPDAGSGDLHHHRYRDGHRGRPDRAVRRPARHVRRRADRDLLCGLCRAAVRRRHRAGRASLVHRADRDLGRHVVGVARAAADPARQISRAAGDPVSRGAGDARLWPGRRGVALSRRGAAQRGPAASVRDLQRGAADHDARAVEGRARPRAGRAGRASRPPPAKPLGTGAGDLHRLDGDPRARLSAAFQHQQRAVLPALCQAGRVCNGCCRCSGSASTSRCFRPASSSSTAAG